MDSGPIAQCFFPPPISARACFLRHIGEVIGLVLERDDGNRPRRPRGRWSRLEFRTKFAVGKVAPIGLPTPFALLSFLYKWVIPNSISITNTPLFLSFALSKPHHGLHRIQDRVLVPRTLCSPPGSRCTWHRPPCQSRPIPTSGLDHEGRSIGT